tara:strand:+ start:1629 stop:1985 length:357 start_codon:yes stop_codon:yes gene_type:complete
VFCRTCVTAALLEKKACPLCRGPYAEGNLIEAPPPDDDKNGAKLWLASVPRLTRWCFVSAKTRSAAPPARGGPKRKAVVFSQFVKYLIVAQQAVTKAGFATARLVGAMSAPQRDVAIR